MQQNKSCLSQLILICLILDKIEYLPTMNTLQSYANKTLKFENKLWLFVIRQFIQKLWNFTRNTNKILSSLCLLLGDVMLNSEMLL